MIPLAGVRPVPVPTVEKPEAARETALRKAAAEFEAMFVEILLKSADLPLGGGESSSPVYGDMAVSAWSGELGRSGGFGIADVLVHALARGGDDAERPPVRPETGTARYRALMGDR